MPNRIGASPSSPVINANRDGRVLRRRVVAMIRDEVADLVAGNPLGRSTPDHRQEKKAGASPAGLLPLNSTPPSGSVRGHLGAEPRHSHGVAHDKDEEQDEQDVFLECHVVLLLRCASEPVFAPMKCSGTLSAQLDR
jgi:hypothetical protein